MKHKLTRLTSLLLAFIMTFSMLLVPVEAAEFSDVPNGSWYAGAVDYVYEKGWMVGVGDSTFAPNLEVTRGMFVTVLAKYAQADLSAVEPAFTDTPNGAWYTGPCAWAAEKGITAGAGDGLFLPNRSITRQDLVTILYRFIEKMGYSIPTGAAVSFNDMDQASAYAVDAVNFCASAGLVAGVGDGGFHPLDTATRSQLAVILMKLDSLVTGSQLPADPRPAQDFDGEDNDMTITVNAPEGALPEDSSMSVSRVVDEGALSEMTKRVKTDVFAAVDISFTKDGAEIEPNKAVQVQISLDGLDSLNQPTVIHLKDDGTMEYVSNVEMVSVNRSGSVKALRFYADSFSVYVIIDGNEDPDARLTIQFWNPVFKANGTYELKPGYTVYVTRHDIAGADSYESEKNYVPSLIADPAIFQPTGNLLFCGWSFNEDFSSAEADGEHTIEFIRKEVYNFLKDPTNQITDGETVLDVYPIIFNFYTVTYQDELGDTVQKTVPVYTKSVETTVPVDCPYEPYGSEYRHIGWLRVDNGEVFDREGDSMRISSSVILRAVVAKGKWLTFIEAPKAPGNTGDSHYKGATYNPPVFCPNGVIPADARPEENPELVGYDFDDWYASFTEGATPDQDTWSSAPFDFNQVLQEDTSAYAKWNVKSDSDYKIIVWHQNINDDKDATENLTWDYYRSYTKKAAHDTSISELDLSEYQSFQTTGFVYYSTEANSDKVLRNGTTVVNVYYKRVLVTYNFNVSGYQKYSKTVMANNYGSYTFYALGSDGNFHTVKRGGSSGNYYYYCQVTSFTDLRHAANKNEAYGDGVTMYWFNRNNSTYYVYFDTTLDKWVCQSGNTKYEYTEAVFNTYTLYEDFPSDASYFLKTGSSSIIRATYTGLYGQSLTKYGYSWPTDFRWYLGSYNGTNFVSTTDNFTFSASYTTDNTTNYYGGSQGSGAYVYHYYEKKYDSGDGGDFEATPKFTIPCNTNDGMVFRPITGFRASQYRVYLGSNRYYVSTSVTENPGSTSQNPDFTFTWESTPRNPDSDGWSEWIDNGVMIKYGSFNPDDDSHWQPLYGKIEFRYTRLKSRITYMVGKYVKEVNNVEIELDGPVAGTMGTSRQVPFEGSLNSFAKGEAEYCDPIQKGWFTDPKYYFDGWYVDETCTTPYVFTGKEMPTGGVTVYAKFRLREYRIFLEPNTPEGANVQYLNGQQANFKRAYGDQLNAGGESIEVTDANEKWAFVGWYWDEALTQLVNFNTLINDQHATDYLDSERVSSDANRPWINKKIKIYGKWRKILEGANGIHVIYNADYDPDQLVYDGSYGDGTTTWEDSQVYSDGAHVITRSASIPDAENYQFLYWEVLDAQGNPTGQIVYAGGGFDMDATYAHIGEGSASGGNAAQEPKPTLNSYDAALPTAAAHTANHAEENKAENTAAGDSQNAVGTGPVTAAGDEVWVETTTITPGEEYLIGVVDSGNVYLILNYSKTGNHYYYQDGPTYSSNYDNYNTYYEGYAALAVLNSAGQITGINDSTANSISNCTWKFSTANGGRIVSTANSSRYLYGDFTVSTYNYFYNNYIRYLYSNTTAATWTWDSSRSLLYTRPSSSDYSYYILPAYYNENGTNVVYGDIEEALPDSGSVKLYVRKTLANYTVTAAVNNNSYGTAVVSGSPVVEGNSAVITATLATGYTYADPAYTVTAGTAVVTQNGNTFTVTPESDCTVQINFERAVVTHDVVLMDGQTNSQIRSFEVEDGDPIPSEYLNAPEHSGYTFSYWAVDTAAGQSYDTDSAVTADLTLWAVYTEELSPESEIWYVTSRVVPGEEYLIGYDDGNGNVYLLMNYNPDQLQSLASGSETNTNENYYYATAENSWFAYGVPAILDDDGHVIGLDNTYPNATLRNTIWIFEKNGENFLKIRSGYESDHYLRISHYADRYDDAIPSDEHLEYSTNWQWDLDQHHLSYKYLNLSRVLTYKEAVDGHSHFFYAPIDGEAGKSNIKLYSRTAATFTVTFHDPLNENAVISEQEVTVYESAVAPSAPIHIGYLFKGWVDADGNPANYSNVTEDMDVFADYEYHEGTFTVHFQYDDGTPITGISDQQVAASATVTDPDPDHTKVIAPEGYHFKEWRCNGVYFNLNTPVTKDLTLVPAFGKDERIRYTLTLRAVYGPMRGFKTTHVTWYADNEENYHADSNTVILNTEIDILDPTTDPNFANPGYKFIGWARMSENEKQQGYTGNVVTDDDGKIINYQDLKDTDLWLIYHGPDATHTKGYFTTKVEGENGSVSYPTVKYIAANEYQPYHGLYAVWAPRTTFYVFHSATGLLESFDIPSGDATDGMLPNNSTISLPSLVTANHLYGGYYKVYGGVWKDGVEKLISESEAAEFSNGWSTPSSYEVTGGTTLTKRTFDTKTMKRPISQPMTALP